jgi:hypothetical protein
MRQAGWSGAPSKNPIMMEAASVGGLFHVYANSSAPNGVNRTNVPLSCIDSQPRSIASFTPAPYSAGLALS